MASRVTTAVCVLWVTVTIVGTGRAQAVRALADPDAIVFRGASAFTPGQIAQGLRHDEELQLALRSTTNIADYLDMLQQRLLLGYLHAGFGKATVSVTCDDSEVRQVIAQIDEGPPFTCGEIHVSGVPDDLAQRIRQRLLRGAVHASAEEPYGSKGVEPEFVQLQHWCESPEKGEEDVGALWSPGETAELTTAGSEAITRQVSSALADEGYPSARFHARTEFDQTVAHLQLDVYDRGVQSVVSEIHVDGNQRDTDEEFIRHVGVEIGERWTAQCRQQILRRLWESASFCDYGVTASVVAGQARVYIHVVEYPDASPLAAKPSREDAALLKLREWIRHGEGRERDFVVQYANDLCEGSVIISSREGAVVDLAYGETEEARQHGRHSVVFTTSRVQLYAAQQQARLTWTNTCAAIVPESDLGAPRDPKVTDAHKLLVSISVRPAGHSGPPPAMSVTLIAPPLYFRSLAHGLGVRTEWRGDELKIANSTSTLRVDARTGELLEYVILRGGKLPSRITVRPVANAYRERVASLATDSRDWRVFPDPARILSSTVEFLCLFYSGLREVPPDASEESAAVQQQRQLETVALVGRLAELGLLTPLEHTWNDPETSLEKQFFVPQRHAKVPKSWKELISLRMRDYSSVLFTPGAWPAFVWREGCSMWSGNGSLSRSTIPEICRGGNFGPLACCLLASMLVQDPSLAKEVAGVGLQRLDRENFLQDCRAILEEKQIGGAMARQCCEVLTDLRPREIELIESCLGSPGALARCADALKRHTAADDPALAAARDLWDSWLRSHLTAKLHAIQGTDPLMSTPFPLPPEIR